MAFHKDETFTAIDPPGRSITIADGINIVGQIVGGFGIGQGNAHGFLYKAWHLHHYRSSRQYRHRG